MTRDSERSHEENESGDRAAIAGFISLHESACQPPSPTVEVEEPRHLSDGRVVKAEFWRYTSEDLLPGGKCDVETNHATLSRDELALLTERLLANGEVHMITGSSDDTLSIRIYLEQPSQETPQYQAAVPLGMTRQSAEALLN